jgi:multiple sugar transport system substrate-binding protein
VTRSLLAPVLALTMALAACSSGGSDSSSGKVELTFWTWATNIEKVVDKWNAGHRRVHVTVSRQSQGDELVTKVLTAAKAGNAPDLFQAEYQALRST